MSDPDLLWSAGREPRACRGPRSATFRSRPQGCSLATRPAPASCGPLGSGGDVGVAGADLG